MSHKASAREMRKVSTKQDQQQAVMVALATVLTRGFFGRMKWLLFGR